MTAELTVPKCFGLAYYHLGSVHTSAVHVSDATQLPTRGVAKCCHSQAQQSSGGDLADRKTGVGPSAGHLR